ncbi:MAG: response regulator transcription factor [Lutibacter sp.]|uniref:LytR/AlgR family response regulator transcription factor n=1 Tax=Lutibacter sp. TaxID=1925666 RepID=UPI0018043BD5|nr:LytTR family DNA-binding domain-containing protein [Lutibacter sp.]MBT8318191.1 LytTR family DNA-binding domain-containing protein [Lutibacter sp.]NNJ59051.1 response regulator transcription factor [Lutibacter sp.]
MIKCIAIDDEPLALKQISNYVHKTPFLELLQGFESPLEAISYVQENEVDLLFVDINMPDLNGIDFVKSLSNAPKIIFTTAYSEYALEGFRVDALDYLLKPIDYATFLKAATKAQEWFTLQNNSSEELKGNDDFLFIKSEYKIIRVKISEIKYIEGMREYIRIHLANEKPIMTLLSMKAMDKQLENNSFMRVHRSYIVNLNKISTIERNRIVFDKVYIPVSDQYKEKFHQFIEKNFLS